MGALETWAVVEAYERYVGRWSRPVAREFVDWLGLPKEKRWLEIGCGTGSLTGVVLQDATPGALVAVVSRSPPVRSSGLSRSARHTPTRISAFAISSLPERSSPAT